MNTITSGNPYTHEEHERTSFKTPLCTTGWDINGSDCDYCGQEKKVLYRYNGRKGYFCSKSCYHAYHG